MAEQKQDDQLEHTAAMNDREKWRERVRDIRAGGATSYIYEVHSKSFQTFLYRHLKLSYTLENSVCYCYTSYEME